MSNLEKRAAIFAKRWHGAQLRKYTLTPYWVHPAAVVQIVKTVPHTEAMLAAAWLHDILEDTPVTEATLRAEFGDAIADYVVALSDPKGGNREARKAASRAKLLAAPAAVKTIKLADLIDNTKSIVARDPKFAVVYLREKRLLLDGPLRDGHPLLWRQADRLCRQGEAL
jgi:(p)ppGpp synthase/HD superfamily hydrolase